MNEQTLGNFYLSCDTLHRELFSIIIHEWQEAGLAWRWSGRAIALGSRSVIRDQVLNFFYLQPGESIYPACISLDTEFWRELLGEEETDAFLHEVKSIHGLHCRRREQMFIMDDPAHLSGPLQQQLRDCIKRLGYRLPELIAA